MNWIGAHMSVAGGLEKAFQRIEIVGGECLQIFVKPSVQWQAPDLSLEEVVRFRTEQKRTGIAPVVAHASYLLNPASPDKNLRDKSILTLALELVRAARLGIEYLILHPGSHREAGEKKGIERIAKGIDRALARAGVPDTKILLETMPGAGSQLGCRLEQLRDIMARSRNPERLGVCLDTCHVLAGGYDIVSLEGYEDFLDSFQRLIGLDRLKCLHINDSKTPLGSRVDRHEQIGQGRVNIKTFQRLLNDPRLDGLPFILETPKGKKGEDHWDEINIRLLKTLRKPPGC
ncbi:MAG: deoxyribonuclease IV [Deltaproteobacteria bacterium]|nr:deoxyribonuclease IV [Deltaproteobacteria bacterium]